MDSSLKPATRKKDTRKLCAIFAALDNEDAEVLKLLINNDMLATDDFFYQNADALLEKSISARNIEQATA